MLVSRTAGKGHMAGPAPPPVSTGFTRTCVTSPPPPRTSWLGFSSALLGNLHETRDVDGSFGHDCSSCETRRTEERSNPRLP